MTEKSKENGADALSLYQCMSCSHKLEAKQAPDACPKCGSQLSFSRVSDWRFF